MPPIPDAYTQPPTPEGLRPPTPEGLRALWLRSRDRLCLRSRDRLCLRSRDDGQEENFSAVRACLLANRSRGQRAPPSVGPPLCWTPFCWTPPLLSDCLLANRSCAVCAPKCCAVCVCARARMCVRVHAFTPSWASPVVRGIPPLIVCEPCNYITCAITGDVQ